MAFPFGAIASGIGGVLSSLMSNNSAQRSIDFQRQENALNRKFNSEEAQKSRDFQRQMFDAENAYNDPKRVVSRLMSAGINPAVAFGNFANSASVSGGDSASYGSGVNPPMPDWSGIQSAGRAALDNEMIQAQIKLAESQANKNNAEIPWIDRLNTLDEEIKKLGVNLGNEDLNLKKETGENMIASREILKQTLQNLKTVGEISKEQLKQSISESHIKEVAAKFAEERGQAELDNLVAHTQQLFESAHLSRVEALQVAGITPFLVQQAEYNAGISKSQNTILGMDASQIDMLLKSTPWTEVVAWKRDEIVGKLAALQASAKGRTVDWLNGALQFGQSLLFLRYGAKGIAASSNRSVPPPPPLR